MCSFEIIVSLNIIIQLKITCSHVVDLRIVSIHNFEFDDLRTLIHSLYTTHMS